MEATDRKTVFEDKRMIETFNNDFVMIVDFENSLIQTSFRGCEIERENFLSTGATLKDLNDKIRAIQLLSNF